MSYPAIGYPKEVDDVERSNLLDIKKKYPNGYFAENAWNAIYWDDHIPLRDRVDVLILDPKKENLLIWVKDKNAADIRKRYLLPGGSLEETKDVVQQAIRESQEEVRITVKDVVDSQKDYVIYKEYTFKKEGAPVTYLGTYNRVCTAIYSEQYFGNVDKHDLNETLYREAKFVPIKDVIDFLLPAHRDALNERLA